MLLRVRTCIGQTNGQTDGQTEDVKGLLQEGNSHLIEHYDTQTPQLTHTSGYATVVHGRPKTPKNTSFLGSPSPQGSQSPYILGDTTRPGHVTCVLV